jgi:hypothetical protein
MIAMSIQTAAMTGYFATRERAQIGASSPMRERGCPSV